MNTQQIIQNTASFIKQALCTEGSGHDWYHIERVWKLSRHIAAQENADIFIVEMSALLHDLEDWKLSDAHDDLPKTKAWLQSQQINTEITQKICHIIHHISFKGAGVADNELPLEGKIVQDADRLDAIGAIGIARTFAYGGHKSRLIYDPEIKPTLHQSFEEYKKNNSSTINHFYEKLLLLKDRMNTKTAKKLAEHKHEIMVKFLHDFHREWDFA